MTQDEFLSKWRYELAGIVFEASTMGSGTAFGVQRAALLHRIEVALKGMFADLSVPPGPIPAKLLAELRNVFATIKELTPEKPKAEAPKGAK